MARLKELDRVMARTKVTPLGRRQDMIFAYARMRVSGGQTFPTLAEIKGFLCYPHGEGDLYASVLGLAARGLIASTRKERTKRGLRAAGWQITDAGWAS